MLGLITTKINVIYTDYVYLTQKNDYIVNIYIEREVISSYIQSKTSFIPSFS